MSEVHDDFWKRHQQTISFLYELGTELSEARAEIARLKEGRDYLHQLIADAWMQWSLRFNDGHRDTGGLSTLEDIESVLESIGWLQNGRWIAGPCIETFTAEADTEANHSGPSVAPEDV